MTQELDLDASLARLSAALDRLDAAADGFRERARGERRRYATALQMSETEKAALTVANRAAGERIDGTIEQLRMMLGDDAG